MIEHFNNIKVKYISVYYSQKERLKLIAFPLADFPSSNLSVALVVASRSRRSAILDYQLARPHSKSKLTLTLDFASHKEALLCCPNDSTSVAQHGVEHTQFLRLLGSLMALGFTKGGGLIQGTTIQSIYLSIFISCKHMLHNLGDGRPP